MKPNNQRLDFIQLRAEGKSYSKIAKILKISKSTCSSWEQELKDEIAEFKGEQLEELYNSYYMTREARIRKLGDTLDGINTALEGVDFNEISPEKLLDYKLKYTEALKEEYISTAPPIQLVDQFEPKDILIMLNDLLNRVKAGDVSTEQANRESIILTNLLKAYEGTELKEKLETLESLLGGRA